MKKVDLVIPGLLNLPQHELNPEVLRQATPCLHRLLRFASQTPNSLFDIDAILIHRLALQQGALPYAYAMNNNREQAQLIFRPVHLKSDMNNAIVYPVDELDGDIHLLIKDLSDYFKEDCTVEELSEMQWIMHLHERQPLAEVPHYLTAVGKKVTHYLQQAKSNLGWFKLFNEMQMFLFQHESNQQRFNAGLPMINSLWCWGADAYAGEFFKNICWLSDDALMQGLGQLYSGQSLPLAAIRDNTIDTDIIISELSLLKALKGDSHADVLEILQQFETECLQPVMQSDATEINVYTAGPFNYHYKPSMAWKFWKNAGRGLIN